MLKGEEKEVTTAVVMDAVGAVEGTETVVVYSLYATTVFPLYAVCFTVPVALFVVGISAPNVAVAHVAFTLVAVVLVAKVAVVPPKVPVIVCVKDASCSVIVIAFAVPIVKLEGTVKEAEGADKVAVYVLVPQDAVPL